MAEPGSPKARQRLSREDRLRQLVEIARQIVRDEGADALTLGRLAERAGVSRPVVYDHFETRNGLLKALYEDYDARRMAVLQAALVASPATLADRAKVIAETYVECVLTEGTDIPGVAAALAGSPELEAFRRGYQGRFIARCRTELEPFLNGKSIAPAKLWAMLGAADALSEAVLRRDLAKSEAEAELVRMISSISSAP
ncbi:TetR/AcrR family transcriptional regulator [Methylobacterium nodulans]|uniref:Transcriptional regulator, TetR family n=1 Tax=Methylobacterium nodulans (strain LMG 21967 / CNCM I-2342 / ORS 2060) TaxID=460265 RepID=B8IIH2_METNO|nr:TetR/AcrR family transcriptional regulator [Methylobacterium nodulans]ACL59849.1 transcriptional regulator, TetR family [Methylobacterium nodulans ORS 2060]